MKTSKMLAAVVIGLSAVIGCVSVESTKAQLASGDPGQIKAANENIYKRAVDARNPYLSIQERVQYVELATDFDLLLRILKQSYHETEIANAVVRQMDFKAEGNTVKLLDADAINGLPDGRRSAFDAKSELCRKILASAGEKDLIGAIKKQQKLPHEWQIQFAERLAKVTTSQDVLFSLLAGDLHMDSRVHDAIAPIVLPRLTDQQKLVELLFKINLATGEGKKSMKTIIGRLHEDTICAFIRNDNRLERFLGKYHDDVDNGWLAGSDENPDRADALLERITDMKKVVKALVSRKDKEGTHCLLRRMPQMHVAAVAVLAGNESIRNYAIASLRDANAIKQILMSNRIADEDALVAMAKKLKAGDADAKLYASVKSCKVKQAILLAVSPAERAKIREADRGRCEQMIAAAKAKDAETFQLGGFYLGMPYEDVEPLLGYYFPTWSMLDATDSDGDKMLRVPGQNSPFCHADSTGKIWRFNFGKQILKKFYDFDVQTYVDWWQQYMAAVGIKELVMRRQEATYTPDGVGPNIAAVYNQNTYQYKSNSKGYRTIFYDEYKILSEGASLTPTVERNGKFTSIHAPVPDGFVKDLAEHQFRHLIEQPGTLRVQFARD